MSMFTAPASSAGLDLEANKGALVIFKPVEKKTGVQTTMGPADVTVADVWIVDGANAGDALTEVFIFPKVLQSQLSAALRTGDLVLGRIGQRPPSKPGFSPAWSLDDPTPADIAAAERFWASLNTSTFAAPEQAEATRPF